MDAILTDSHIYTRLKVGVLVHVIVPGQDYAGEVWEGDVEFVKQLESV